MSETNTSLFSIGCQVRVRKDGHFGEQAIFGIGTITGFFSSGGAWASVTFDTNDNSGVPVRRSYQIPRDIALVTPTCTFIGRRKRG